MAEVPHFFTGSRAPLPADADLPKLARKKPEVWRKLITPRRPPTSVELARVVEFRAFLETKTPLPGLDRFQDIHLVRFLTTAKGDFDHCRNLLIQSLNFRRTFNIDSMNIADFEHVLRNGMTVHLSKDGDVTGAPIMYMEYHFENGFDSPQTVLDIVLGFVYILKIAEEIMDECGQAPLMLMNMSVIKTSDFDPRLEKSLIRVYTEIFPMIMERCLGFNTPVWMRIMLRLFAPWIPKEFTMWCEKKSSVCDAIAPKRLLPPPYGTGASMEDFIAWRRAVEGPSLAPHSVDESLLRSWNISTSEPARDQEAIIKGVGWKRTKARRKWTKYFFVLGEGVLHYYKNDRKKVANNGLLLEEARIGTHEEDLPKMERAKVTKKPRSNVLVVETIEREYFFSFPSPEIMEQWRTALQSEITRRQEETGVHFGEGRVVMVEDMGLDGAEEEELDAFEEAEAAEVEALEAEIAAAEAE